MRSKIVWNMANGLPEKAFENRKRPGEYMIPGGCVEVEPPEFDAEKYLCKYVEGEWVLEEMPEPEKPNYDLYHEPVEDVPGEITKKEVQELSFDSPELSIVEEPVE